MYRGDFFMFLTYLFLALSLSIDSIGIGITYGLRNTKIPMLSKFILFLISVTFTTIALMLGNLITKFLPDYIANLIGSFILIFIGIWILFQIFHNNDIQKVLCPNGRLKSPLHIQSEVPIIEQKNSNEPKIYSLFIKFFGITIQIIKHPISSDLDNSKVIDWKEACFLGIALSIDSISVSIGGGITGLSSLLFPILVATFHITFLFLGKFLGHKLNNIQKFPENICNVISGVLLIIIGITRFFV